MLRGRGGSVGAFLENVADLFRRDIAVNTVIDHDDRRQTARPDTPQRAEEEFSVFGSLPLFDIETAFEFFQHFARSLHKTGGADADIDFVPSDRFVREIAVKADDSVDFRMRNFEAFGDILLDIFRQKPENVLCLMENLNQISPFPVRKPVQRNRGDVAFQFVGIFLPVPVFWMRRRNRTCNYSS